MSFHAPMLTQPLRIAIVGGGIAGLSAALSLQHFQKEGANITFKLYEKASKFLELGAGVAFGPNAQRALEIIGVKDALDKVQSFIDPDLDPNLWFTFKVGEAQHINQKAFFTIKGINASKGNVHRADFLDEMVSLIRDGVAMFDCTCNSYSPHVWGVTLHFANQPDAEADVIIASDGINSHLRSHLYHRLGLPVESQMARYAEWVAWRGLIPISAFRKAMGQNCDHNQILLGTDRHIVHFPIRNGNVINIIGFVRDPEHHKLGDHAKPWVEKRPKAEMLRDFNCFTENCLAMLSEIEEPSIWGIFTVPELETAIDDRIGLIGDAAHAMTPHQGAGAGQAIEDALFLSALLCSPDVCKSNPAERNGKINQALKIYQQVRHRRGREIQKTSREAGLLYEFRGEHGEGDDLGKIACNLEQRMRQIWEWDIKAELTTALEFLQ